jgi:hypothetical protein
MYEVKVDSNFNFMDEAERWGKGSFTTLDEAMAACRQMVDEDLAQYLRANPHMTASKLYSMFAAFGDDPFIPGGEFFAHDYARKRAKEMCS